MSLPLDDVELVIEQSLLFQTAVFWALQEPRDRLVELPSTLCSIAVS